MKKAATLKNRIISASLAFAMLALCFTFLSVITPGTSVYAAQRFDSNSYSMSSGRYGYSIASSSDIATIVIDESKLLNPVISLIANTKVTITNSGGTYTDTNSANVGSFEIFTGSGGPYILYKRQGSNNAQKFRGSSRYDLDGSIILTYEGAAILPDNSRKNLIIEITNISLFTTTYQTINSYFTGSVRLVRYNYTDKTGSNEPVLNIQAATWDSNPYGMKYSLNTRVSDSSADDTFFFTAYDLNLDRSTVDNARRLYDSANNFNFSESMSFKDYPGTVYYNHSFYAGGVLENGKVFTAKGAGSSNTNAYATSLVALLAEASDGVNAVCWTYGPFKGTSDFVIMNDGITHTTTASSGVGGKIELWKTGVIDDGDSNKLLDSSTIPASDTNKKRTFDVPDGKVITYKLTPNEGFVLDKVTIGKKGSATTVVPVNTVYNPDGTVKYYTYMFNESSSAGGTNLFNINNEIRVDWQPAAELTIIRADGVSEQDFWYTVQGDETGTVIEVCIPAGSDRVTVKGVRPYVNSVYNGIYYVTEKGEWSWRYPTELVLNSSHDTLKSTDNVYGTGSQNFAQIIIEPGTYEDGKNIIVFKDPRNDNEWLGGYNRRKNHYTVAAADPITQEKWTKFLYGTTEYTGMIWSDKSLTTADSTTLEGAGMSPITINKADGADFLVDFSLFSSTEKESNEKADLTDVKDIDIVFAVDRSADMNTYVDGAPVVELYKTTFNFDKNQADLLTDLSNMAEYNGNHLYYKSDSSPDLMRFSSKSGDDYTFTDGTVTEVVTIDSSTIGVHIERLFSTAPYNYIAYQGIVGLATEFKTHNANINMALVGFGDNSGEYTGTGLYKNDGSWVGYNNRAAAYSNAFFNIDGTDAKLNAFISAARSLFKNASGTSSYVNRGVEMARGIFDNNPGDGRNRTVLIIKDGVVGDGTDYDAVTGEAINAIHDTSSGIIATYTDDTKNNTAQVYVFGFFDNINVDGDYSSSYASLTSEEKADRTYMSNWLLSNLSSNHGAAPAAMTNYFHDGMSDTAASFANEFANKSLEDVYNEGTPLDTYAGEVKYTDELGDYMEIVEGEMTLVAFGKEYKLNYSGSDVTFAPGQDLNVTNDLDESINLNDEMTFNVVKGATLKDGDVIKITVNSSAIPLRSYTVTKLVNGEFVCSVERDRPLHVFYNVKLKDDAKDYLDNPGKSVLDNDLREMERLALKSYIRRNTHDNGTVMFYANKFVPGADKGSATAVFTPGNTTEGGINHFYYFANPKSPLYALNSNGVKQQVTGVTYADIKSEPDKYFFEIPRYDFNDSRLSGDVMPQSGTAYRAKKTAERVYLDQLVDGKHMLDMYEKFYGVSDDNGVIVNADNIGKYLTTDSDGWYIPQGAVKFVHKGQLSYGKSENVTDTAKMALTDDQVGNSNDGSITVTEYLGNNGLIYYSRNNNG